MGDNLVTDDSNQVQIILFGEKLSILTLSEGEIVSEQEFTFQMMNSEVYVNGKELAKGTNTVDNELIFVLETKTIYAKYLFPPSKDFIISNGREADLSIQANAYVLFAENKVYLYPNGSLLYINNQLVSSDVVRPFNVGDCIFVENYFIERRENQWQVFSLFKEPIFNKKSVLIENKKNIF